MRAHFALLHNPLHCLHALHCSLALFTRDKRREGDFWGSLSAASSFRKNFVYPTLKISYYRLKTINTENETRKSIELPETNLKRKTSRFSPQTWPYIFQQVPDLNANKIPIASSKEASRKSDFTQPTSMSFASFDDDSHIRSVTHHPAFGSRCHDDFEMSYD